MFLASGNTPFHNANDTCTNQKWHVLANCSEIIGHVQTPIYQNIRACVFVAKSLSKTANSIDNRLLYNLVIDNKPLQDMALPVLHFLALCLLNVPLRYWPLMTTYRYGPSWTRQSNISPQAHAGPRKYKEVRQFNYFLDIYTV